MSHVSAYNGLTGNLTGTDILGGVPGLSTNQRVGTLTLNGATPVTVSNTLVTANSAIFLTTKTSAGTPAFRWVSARSAGVSFSVTGTAGDTSVLNYLIVEPV
jgi:hypothetical protein